MSKTSPQDKPPDSFDGSALFNSRRAGLALLGPAFVASVAYVDPGNFASNIAAGSEFGYLLVWVLVAANLMAMVVQYLSAKLGIATGANLPELCRRHFPQALSRPLWLQAELVAMATDIAEFVGAALALYLLFDIPLFWAGLITATVSLAILSLQRHRHRRFELAIIFFLAVILVGFLYNLIRVGFSLSDALTGLVPRFDGSSSVLLAVAIVGATVMPHVIYLHSELARNRVRNNNRDHLLKIQRFDVIGAMGLAGVINLLMLVVAAALFFGYSEVEGLTGAFTGFFNLVGPGAAIAFALALLASGMASSSVGTYSGQVVMDGFIERRLPLLLRRLITMAPALVILALGLNPTKVLIISQVVLSFGIPFALVPLIIFTGRRSLMGSMVNRPTTQLAAWVITALITALNLFLLISLLAG